MLQQSPDEQWLRESGFERVDIKYPNLAESPIWSHPCCLVVYGFGLDSESWMLLRTSLVSGTAIETCEEFNLDWNNPTKSMVGGLIAALDQKETE